MSRHLGKQSTITTQQAKVAEDFVNYIIQTSTPKAIKLNEICAETIKDPTLQAVVNAVCTSNWTTAKKDV